MQSCKQLLQDCKVEVSGKELICLLHFYPEKLKLQISNYINLPKTAAGIMHPKAVLPNVCVVSLRTVSCELGPSTWPFAGLSQNRSYSSSPITY